MKAHKRNIFEKADVRKTAELVNKLGKTGII
ncbi:MAG: hypothetical protein ACK514_05500 [Bacteroidota bacterium]|nr:hypothetical protein [Cytophagales bacterium]